MAPIKTPWTRLIRFVAVETGRVHIGQPVDSDLDVGLAYAQKSTIKAYEILGSTLSPGDAHVSSEVLTIHTLLSPLDSSEIPIIRALGLNYSDHAAEAKMAIPDFPILFYKPLKSLLGPGAAIIIPRAAQPPKEHLPDYEVELVIVVGKAAKDVKEEEALDYVLGYTGANDISFRKHQLAVSQWGFSKSFDNTNPLGPVLVSNSLIPNPQTVPLKCTLNGSTVQDGTTADMIFGVRHTIAFLSQGTTLEPGTIILTGTPKGVGFVKQPPLYLKDGDKVAVWVGGGIGTLVNEIKEEGKGKLTRAKL
ncbi:fumarylacetoacetate hydrolase [Crepidotus variabilis]|uniref:Fumarylacetoacetate hydrolase n=1 Tax=Crepidotus variabilis TaxID=179855 RepID=A0A9P6ETJ3_9AGAR|nr:fumarylacetoacetate hydrolase [Crepidotus variabilis]